MWRKLVLNTLYFSGAQALLKPVLGGLGSILMLHRVENVKLKPFSPNYHLSAAPEFLDFAILHLKNQGYEFISLDEVAMRLARPQDYRDAKPFLSITLDDGYRDNVTNALGIFKRHHVPFAVYVAPNITEAKSALWWEDVEHVIAAQKKISLTLPTGKQEFDVSNVAKKISVYKYLVEHLLLETDQYEQRKIVDQLCRAYGFDWQAHVRNSVMNWQEIITLSKEPLCTIGAHTMNHYALFQLPFEDAKSEILQSREVISSKIGTEPKHLAYPYGFPQVAKTREFNMVRELGFSTATTTRHGVIYPEHKDHMTALPRVSLNGHHQSMRYVDTLLSGIPARSKNRGKKLDVA